MRAIIAALALSGLAACSSVKLDQTAMANSFVPGCEGEGDTVMREHEYLLPDDQARKWCRYCGCLWHAQMTATCVERPAAADTAPHRRVRPLDDLDTIRARLAELRKEQDDALANPDAPIMDFHDCCCC